jgi:hypothetical protein
VTAVIGARGPERNAPEASVGPPLAHEDQSWFPTVEAGGIFPAPSPEKSAPYDSNPAFGGTPGLGSTWPLRHSFFQRTKVSFLQKPLTPSFRRKPESRIAQKNWIPGRALLARNDDFLLLSRVLHEAQKLKNKKWFIAELAENAENNFLNSEIPKKTKQI